MSTFKSKFRGRLPLTFSHFIQLCFALALCTLLAACGGGGGGSPAGSSAPAAIVITAQPTDITVVEGTNAIFSVVATGDVSYQWQRLQGGSWADVSGATGPQISIVAAAPSESGANFRVVITSKDNPAARVVSSAVTLTVTAAVIAPTVAASPSDATVMAGQNVSFSVTASGSSLTYQWQTSSDGLSWEPIAQANAATLTLPAVVEADSGRRYRVVLTNSAGTATSGSARLTVTIPTEAPVFYETPQSASVTEGQTASFTAAAVGRPAPTVAWQQSRDGRAWSEIPGANSGSYTTQPVSIADDGMLFRMVATNALGDVASRAATLTVLPLPMPPTIAMHPRDLRVGAGGSASFSVSASGTQMTYQWQVSMDGGVGFVNINGAVSQSYFATTVTPADSGKRFRVVVANDAGSIISESAQLTVLQAPEVTLHPTDQTWFPGDTDAMFVAAAAGDDITYQWQAADASGEFLDVPGATGTAYVHAANASPSVEQVRVVVRNLIGSSTSGAAHLSAEKSWFVFPRSTTRNLRSIAWVDASTVVAVGESRLVIRSTDAGNSWSVVRADQAWGESALTEVAFNSAGYGIAVADSGHIARSVDGGKHWVWVPVPEGLVTAPAPDSPYARKALHSVAFASDQIAVAVGEYGAILRTTDGGSTWVAADVEATTETFRAVTFNAKGVGLAVGAGGTILRSINGGANWSVVHAGEGFFRSISFADNDAAVAVGWLGRLRSTDGGKTWSDYNNDLAIYEHVHFVNERVGYETDNLGTLRRTGDGGATWVAVATYDRTRRARAVRFASPELGLAVGESGTIERSTDGGVTWNSVHPQGMTFNHGAFTPQGIGIAVGTRGLNETAAIMRSTDAGASWTAVEVPPVGGLTHVAFADGSIAIAVGQSGAVLRTLDGGANWTRVTPEGGAWQTISSTAFANTKVGVMAGWVSGPLFEPSFSQLARTADSGATWQPVFQSTALLSGVAFADDMLGLAVGANGTIVRTTDGGQTWSPVDSPTTSTLTSVSFASPLIAVATALENSGFRSTDGGVTWHPMPDIFGRFDSREWTTHAGFVGGTGVYTAPFKAVVTRDAGLTWTETHNFIGLHDSDNNVISFHGQASVLASEKSLFMFGAEGTIVRRTR